MSDSTLSRLLASARESLPPAGATRDAPGRRRFFRRAGGAAVAALGAGFVLADTAEGRAEQFGITPGTVVDAQGRRVRASGVEPYLGEIMLVGYNFATRGFALCNGQLLPISSNSALFSLLGTTYGGDGRTTFALPDLRSRLPMHFGTGPGLSNRRIGERFGAESFTITTPQMPSHTHAPDAQTGAGTARSPTGNVIAGTPGVATYAAAPGDTQMAPTEPTGGGQPLSHMPPTLVLNYQIALQGIFPSRS